MEFLRKWHSRATSAIRGDERLYKEIERGDAARMLLESEPVEKFFTDILQVNHDIWASTSVLAVAEREAAYHYHKAVTKLHAELVNAAAKGKSAAQILAHKETA